MICPGASLGILMSSWVLMSIVAEPLLLDYPWKISNNGLTPTTSFIFQLLVLNSPGQMGEVVVDTLKRDLIELFITNLG
jgi:hypothetical protein